MYKDYSSNLKMISWICFAIDTAFVISWIKNGFFETPTLLLLLIAVIITIWWYYEQKSEKKERN